jgi:tetratricopeptide (TPR) repeat protein
MRTKTFGSVPAILAGILLLPAFSRTGSALAAQQNGHADAAVAQIAAGAEADAAVEQIKLELQRAPQVVVERLNNGIMEALFKVGRHNDIHDLAVAGSIAVARDTWAIERLQRWRVRSFMNSGRNTEALAAAKALFMVAGMGSAPHDIDLLCRVVRQAHPEDSTLHHRLRLQMLAAAQEDPAVRKAALAKAGESILAGVKIDPEPYRAAIDDLRRRAEQNYDTLYAVGNLLLLSGRVGEAREAFQKAYDAAPTRELNYASEGLAKVLKAEDLGIGRANAFVKSIRPAR